MISLSTIAFTALGLASILIVVVLFVAKLSVDDRIGGA